MALPCFSQDPRAHAFVQDPYPFYEQVRSAGPLFDWPEIGMPCTVDFALGDAIFKHPALGRAAPEEARKPVPPHLADFDRLERHSMLEHDPPSHTALRRQVLKSFTPRMIAELAPRITETADALIDAFPASGSFDLLADFAEPLPVRVIAAMLGIPAEKSADLLRWSHDMVAMYQSRRDEALEHKAAASAKAFHAYITDEIARRRRDGGQDLLAAMVNAENALPDDAIIATAVLLLNAGHEATVHAIGNAVRLILTNELQARAAAGPIRGISEEALRFDPPLHIFDRWVKEPLSLAGHMFQPGEKIGVILAGANRDPSRWEDPGRFDPDRPLRHGLSLGSGVHVCLGAALARLEMDIALARLFERCPGLLLKSPTVYADRYHFHGLVSLMVEH